MRIALTAMDVAWENKSSNMLRCSEIVREAAELESDLVVFPEMTLTGFSQSFSELAELEYDSRTRAFFQQLATENNIAIIFGVLLKSDKGITNSAIAIDRYGVEVSRYQKIHLFSLVGEDKYLVNGDSLATFTLGEIRIGLSICYDLRFANLYYEYSKNCSLVINLANWPNGRINHWDNLMLSRAIENQFFMAGVNRTGKDGNLIDYPASSKLINGNGEICKPIHSGNEVSIYDFSFEDFQKVRQEFNTVQDRVIFGATELDQR